MVSKIDYQVYSPKTANGTFEHYLGQRNFIIRFLFRVLKTNLGRWLLLIILVMAKSKHTDVVHCMLWFMVH